MIYRAELSERVLRQLGDFPAKSFDELITTMSAVVEYPDDLDRLTAHAAYLAAPAVTKPSLP